MHLTLLVPDLILPARPPALPDVYRGLSLPALEYMLGRMSHLPLPPVTLEAWLCDVFEIEGNPDLPMAALSLLADDCKPGDAYWLHADPVHLEPQRDQLVLYEGEQLGITRAEADQFVAALNEHFAPTGESFHAMDAARWYVRASKPLEAITQPLAAAAGRNIGKRLPVGYHAPKLNQLMTEVQMLLHAHPANQAREAQGLSTINSVWLWGGGRLPEVHVQPFSHVWSSNALATGLARASRTHYSGLPAHARAVIEEDVASTHTLVVLDMLRGAAARRDDAAWQKALRSLEEKWMGPLAQAYRKGQIERLTLHALNQDQHLQFTLERSARWQIWRRPDSLARYAGHS
jgi:hypothetical protein